MFVGAFYNLNCYLLRFGIFWWDSNSSRNSLVGFFILLQLVVSFRTWLLVETFGEFLNIYFQYYTETFGGFPQIIYIGGSDLFLVIHWASALTAVYCKHVG